MKLAAEERYKLMLKYLNKRQEELDLSNYAVAKISGLSAMSVGRYMTGTSIPTQIAYLQLLGALELNPYLVPKEMDNTEFNRVHFN